MKVEFISGEVKRPEIGDMFGGWLTEHDGRTFMIDCGVGGGAESLAGRLADRLGGRDLDFVLLTHIHLDHSGGLSEIMKKWPAVKVVAHEKGLRHLCDPERLWHSTREVMGELADLYGRPFPLNPAALIPHTEADLPGLTIFETPGHAPHHLSYRLGGTMFVGEAGGCPHFLNGRLCNRPATPPRYFPARTFESIDLLLREKDETAYFAHTHERLPYHESLRLCKEQLVFWADFLRRPEAAVREGEDSRDYLARLTDRLFEEDPILGPLNSLPPMDLWREKFFMRNSLEGFVQHLAEEAEAGGGGRP